MTQVEVMFPTENEVFDMLTATTAADDTDQPLDVSIEPTEGIPVETTVAVVWDYKKDQHQWFLTRVCWYNNDWSLQ